MGVTINGSGVSFEDDGHVLELTLWWWLKNTVNILNIVNILKTTEFYLLWDVDYISMKKCNPTLTRYMKLYLFCILISSLALYHAIPPLPDSLVFQFRKFTNALISRPLYTPFPLLWQLLSLANSNSFFRSTVNYHFLRGSFFESSYYVLYSSYQILHSLIPFLCSRLISGLV